MVVSGHMGVLFPSFPVLPPFLPAPHPETPPFICLLPLFLLLPDPTVTHLTLAESSLLVSTCGHQQLHWWPFFLHQQLHWWWDVVILKGSYKFMEEKRSIFGCVEPPYLEAKYF